MEIRLNQVSKRFGKQIIFENVSTIFPSGQTIGLIGPNGIGKTTLIRMMFNLDDQYEGEFYFNNHLNRDVRVFRDAYFMQDNQVLYPQLTAYDYLRFLVDIHELKVEAINDVAKLVGIESYLHKKVENYSLGMKQHLLIAMALIHDPKCIVMDEPFNGLDPTSIHDFKIILKELKKKNKTIIMSSHNLSIIQELVDQVFLVKDKQLVTIELNKIDENKFVITLHTVDDQKAFIQLANDHSLKIDEIEEQVIISGDLTQAINLLVKYNLSVKSVKTIQFRMEELYKEYYF